MNLYSKLQQRATGGNPIRIGLIGAGKFGSMYLAQVPRMPGVHLVAIADLSPDAARANLARVGWQSGQAQAASAAEALKNGTTWVTDDWHALTALPQIDIVVECTGNPVAAVDHILEAFRQGKHVVNVTVEADAFCGPLLARKAAQAGVVYSMAYGDQPAMICELVDWARTCGFPVVAAGRGHKWLPHFSESTPETVWVTTASRPSRPGAAASTPRCSTAFWMAPSPASRARRSPMPPAWRCPATACSTRLPASKTSPT